MIKVKPTIKIVTSESVVRYTADGTRREVRHPWRADAERREREKAEAREKEEHEEKWQTTTKGDVPPRPPNYPPPPHLIEKRKTIIGTLLLLDDIEHKCTQVAVVEKPNTSRPTSHISWT